MWIEKREKEEQGGIERGKGRGGQHECLGVIGGMSDNEK